MEMVVRGRCWKLGDNVPTDYITPITILFMDFPKMAKQVLKRVRPEFADEVKPGDILVAGKNFGCSSGRAAAPKALKATGLGAVVAEEFSRTFFRNAVEIALPVLVCPDITSKVEDGQQLEVNISTGEIKNLTTGETVQAQPPTGFYMELLQAGGIIEYLKTHQP